MMLKGIDKAVQTAIDLAQQFRATLTVISVIPELLFHGTGQMDRVRILDTLTTDAKKTLERIKAKATGVLH